MADKELSAVDQLTESLKKVPANLLGGPVDLTNLALGLVQGKGLEGSVKDPVGGSASFMKLFRQSPDSSGPVEDIASFAAGMVNPSAATKTAITASALLGGKILANSKPVVSLLGDVGKVPDMAKATDALTKTTTEAAMIPALLAEGSKSKFADKVTETGKTPKELLKEVRAKKKEGVSVEDIYKEYGVVQSPGLNKWDAVVPNPEWQMKSVTPKLKVNRDVTNYKGEKLPDEYNFPVFDLPKGTVPTLTEVTQGLDPRVYELLSKKYPDIKLRGQFLGYKGDAAALPKLAEIRLGNQGADEVMNTLSHEVQHLIDNAYKRPAGGNPDIFKSDAHDNYVTVAKDARDSLFEVAYKPGDYKPNAYRDLTRANLSTLNKLIDQLNAIPYNSYRNISGELRAFGIGNLAVKQDEQAFIETLQSSPSVTALGYENVVRKASANQNSALQEVYDQLTNMLPALKDKPK